MKRGFVNENPSYLGDENFGQVYGLNSISGEDVRQRKQKQHSNQAQLTGKFMRQMWRIYSLSDILSRKQQYPQQHDCSGYI
ncbi:hypothetical protein KDH_66630 [Dictyobacter sp. S3.2.2.5]|uniref:Uncharacterized protein n=1 Tax=Dictyobacter halimunensis TaxID=3026934 RepID=A0ABQ6FZZ3_9CHLR|nr:hypothetical protein KDH_66630 [Dictyobacter sp. S3.2.2.5]